MAGCLRLGQKGEDLVVGGRRDVTVVAPHGPERVAGAGQHDLVGPVHAAEHVDMPDGRRHHDPGGTEVARDLACHPRGRTRRDPVVDDDRRTTIEGERVAPPAQATDPHLELRALQLLDRAHLALGDPGAGDEVLVEHLVPTFADGAHRELGLERQPELAHHDDVERGAEGSGHLDGNRDTTPGHTEHDDVLVTQVPEVVREPTSRIGAVLEQCRRGGGHGDPRSAVGVVDCSILAPPRCRGQCHRSCIQGPRAAVRGPLRRSRQRAE